MVHCQDAKKIPAPTGAVSWLTSKESSIKPSVIIMGASTMHRTVPSSLSITAAPSADEGGGATGVHSTSPSFQGYQCQCDVISGCFVQSRVESTSGELDSSCVIHPFHVRDQLD